MNCGSVCTDLDSDKLNCGECGYSCRGSTCTKGVCETVFLTNTLHPAALALDETNVYWVSAGGDPPNSTDGKLLTMGKDGNPDGGTPLVTGLATPLSLAVDSGKVYYTVFGKQLPQADAGVLYDGSAVGYVPDGVTVPLGGTRPGSVLVEGREVFVLRAGPPGELVKFNDTLTSGPVQVGADQLSPQVVSSLTATSDHFYWISQNPNQLLQLPRTGSLQATPLVTANDFTEYGIPQALTIRSVGPNQEVLFIDDRLNIRAFLIGQSSPMVVVPGAASSPACTPRCAIVSDESGVYYTLTNDNMVMRYRRSGEQPRIIASGLMNPTALALDAEFIYIANYGGSIVKVAKPPAD
jgi:hypothetical protein